MSQPPTKTAEAYFEEQRRSANNGIALLMLALFTVARTVQVFSRRPGTAGENLVAGTVLAPFLLHVYSTGWIENGVRPDTVPVLVLQLAIVLWWFVDVWYVIRAGRRPRVGQRDLGVGVLAPLLPHWSSESVGLASDLVVSGFLALLFTLGDSPLQATWYRLLPFWILLAHGWTWTRWFLRRQRIREAMGRSRYRPAEMDTTRLQ